MTEAIKSRRSRIAQGAPRASGSAPNTMSAHVANSHRLNTPTKMMAVFAVASLGNMSSLGKPMRSHQILK